MFIPSANDNQSLALAASLLVLFVTALPATRAANGIDHCALNNFRGSHNTTHMQYTKEPVNKEFAVLDQFKSLHCCAKGYGSIEWFKDGKPYPFPGLILYPDERNQTIYTREATLGVAGNYTCVLRNETHKMEHHIELIVKSTAPDSPMATFEPQNIEELPEGEAARFYCEAFVGQMGRDGDQSQISWHRVSRHGHLQKLHSVEISKRDDERVLGAILSLVNVREEDYGDYLCRVETTNPPRRLDMKASLHISPTVARTVSNMHVINTVVAVLAAFLIVLVICVVFLRRHHDARRRKLNSLPHREQMHDSATIEMSFRHHQASSRHQP